MKLHCILITVLWAFGLMVQAADDHWHYPDMDLDEDFPHWGGVCDTGKRQSPINLARNGALKGIFDELEFDDYDDAQKEVAMVNNGHTIQLYDFPHEMTLKGGPLVGEYVVEQIHLHWWSEHTIDNVRYPLEAHIVHRNKRYGNMTEASNHSDGVAVVGVLFHVSNEENEVIDIVIDSLDEVQSYDKLNKATRLKESIVMTELFPKYENYFTYEGSLTTPSCAEVVTWIVLTDTFPVTLEQVEEFKHVEYEENKPLKNNYRFIQNANNRPVIIVNNDERSDHDAAVAVGTSLWGLLAALIVLKLMH